MVVAQPASNPKIAANSANARKCLAIFMGILVKYLQGVFHMLLLGR